MSHGHGRRGSCFSNKKNFKIYIALNKIYNIVLHLEIWTNFKIYFLVKTFT